ncbi:MAG: molybdopterin-dependent oxidoreductase [Novosphingobium sp.]
MDRLDGRLATTLSRRRLLAAGVGGAGLASLPLWAKGLVDLALPGKPSQRSLTTAFPQKGEMILQRARPPLLETPMAVFDEGVLTPNDRFFVRWHWASIPETVDVATFRLSVRGHVERPLSLTLDQLLHDFERIEYVAVNQCSGNSRGLFEPGVPGAEWGHGAMGNARWTGVRLRDVLDRAGVKAGAVDVRLGGLDEALLPDAPRFLKSLAVDHARGEETMIAFAMNGEQLPLLNGFPLRLVVPGWYSTYWVKMLSDIEVLSAKDDQFWMAKAYLAPTAPFGDVAPGTHDFAKAPIAAMTPRSLITSHAGGASVPGGAPLAVRGIALGGDSGVAKVELSSDEGKSWSAAKLGRDEGKYSFRRFEGAVAMPAAGEVRLACRCTNAAGVAQPLAMNWNPNGYMRAGVETVTLKAGAP